MKTIQTSHKNLSDSTLARSVAAEDLRVGDDVTLLEQIFEYPTFLWHGDSQLERRDEPVRIMWTAPSGGRPLRVKSICLPFVLVKEVDGSSDVIDVRTVRMARLSDGFAQATRQALASKKKRKRKKKKKQK